MASIGQTTESAAPRTLLFRVGATVYGCDIAAVREIVPYHQATRLPGTRPYVNGLINLRGTIITVMDLGVRLEGDGTPATDGSIIIVEVGDRRLGLVVGEVMDVAPVAVARAPDDRADDVVRGLGHLGDTVVIVLDVGALVKQVLL
ncbi:MAG: purine-binding chemotaxis protein CheW [Gemmatimonadota bacterium]|nr:purine-binding chemotaxis protein CheW [Gemmatimonadota bacterium]MDE3127525.1 purine-binding chemotaxis protein CheW [Gemmatimonadota bacterium]MDE3173632.1 purine-binding chemotaxis protein CheW [Gemmatimonadota bacterium]MDE3214921.1 purine-binding chemotaxis protein CheW [Gemmatimonadota bacterium]